MSLRRLHWEKLSLQVITAGFMAVVYFALWRALRMWDPNLPIAFLPAGAYAQAAMFAAIVWVLAAVAGAATVHWRPETALAAALLGAGGVSLRSPPFRHLVWLQEGATSGLYVQLTLEIVLLTLVVIVAALIAALVRLAAGRLRPQWLWRDPLVTLTDAQRRKVAEAAAKEEPRGGLLGLPALSLLGVSGIRLAGRELSRREALRRDVESFGLGLVVAVVVVLLLLRSADRGQILFAVVAGFTAAGTAAHQWRPSSDVLVAWAMPPAVAVGFYVLGWVSAVDSGGLAWMGLDAYARVLPIDWMTFGTGSALLGFWISARMHEYRYLHACEEMEAEQKEPKHG